MYSPREDELIVVWKDENTAADEWTAQNIDFKGKLRWGQEGLSLNPQHGDHENSHVSIDSHGRLTIAWEDASRTPRQIFMQRWDRKGAGLWDVTGAAVHMRSGEQRDPWVIAEDGDVFVLWLDNYDHPWELYAQRIKEDGTPVLEYGQMITPVSPVPIRPMGGSDYSGGAIVMWLEPSSEESSWQLQAVRINGSANPTW
jgi:hypothetical protein